MAKQPEHRSARAPGRAGPAPAPRAADHGDSRAARSTPRDGELGPLEPPLGFGDLEVDRRALVVRGPKGVIDLSLGEFRVFARLAEAAGETVPVAELTASYGVDSRDGRHALEQAISRLRVKLGRRGSRVGVTTLYGIGWRLEAADRSRA